MGAGAFRRTLKLREVAVGDVTARRRGATRLLPSLSEARPKYL